MRSQLKVLCNDILEEGLAALDLSVGIVSKVENMSYLLIAVNSPSDVFIAGERFALTDTYCREVINKRKTVARTELGGQQGLSQHPLYANLPLEAYISAPIIVDDKVWGTLNFSSMKLKHKPFSQHDIAYIEERAQQLSVAIQHYSFYQKTEETRH